LLRTIAVAQPAFIASSAMRRSCEVTPSAASQTTSATSARSGGALRAQRRVVLDRVRDLRLAPHAGGVDEDQLAALRPSAACRSRRAWCRRLPDDHALLAEEAVHQRGLADVGPADDGEADGVPTTGCCSPSGSSSTMRSSRSPDPSPCVADTASGSPSPSLWNSLRAEIADAVDLVRGDDRGRRRPAQQVRPSPRRRAAPRHARRPRARPPARPRSLPALLLADRAGERVLVLEVHAARVDQLELASVPLAVELVRSRRLRPAASCDAPASPRAGDGG